MKLWKLTLVLGKGGGGEKIPHRKVSFELTEYLLQRDGFMQKHVNYL